MQVRNDVMVEVSEAYVGDVEGSVVSTRMEVAIE